MAKLVMGYWDCPVCGMKEIRGDVQNCPSCGRARGDVKFYMKNYTEGEIREENERGDIEYLSEDEAKYVSNNPDWYCSFCDSLNSDNAEYCSNCGASRKDSESNYFDQLKKRKEREEAELAARPSEWRGCQREIHRSHQLPSARQRKAQSRERRYTCGFHGQSELTLTPI